MSPPLNRQLLKGREQPHLGPVASAKHPGGFTYVCVGPSTFQPEGGTEACSGPVLA